MSSQRGIEESPGDQRTDAIWILFMQRIRRRKMAASEDRRVADLSPLMEDADIVSRHCHHLVAHRPKSVLTASVSPDRALVTPPVSRWPGLGGRGE